MFGWQCSLTLQHCPVLFHHVCLQIKKQKIKHMKNLKPGRKEKERNDLKDKFQLYSMCFWRKTSNPHNKSECTLRLIFRHIKHKQEVLQHFFVLQVWTALRKPNINTDDSFRGTVQGVVALSEEKSVITVFGWQCSHTLQQCPALLQQVWRKERDRAVATSTV